MSTSAIRDSIRAHIRADESACIRAAVADAGMDAAARARASDRAAEWVRRIRADGDPGLMELFLEEYGLSSDEGVALMCLAEALLRVPDVETIDALIEDKIAPSAWGRHLGRSSSSLVNASTWALMLTGKVLDDGKTDGVGGALRAAVRRLGEPVIRAAVTRAMKELGQQFVLGRDIEEAMERAAKQEAAGYSYSYDMLGEAAASDPDALRYHLAYSQAIAALAGPARGGDIRGNPGISVKLSALFPRYEESQRGRVMDILVPRTRSLALLAKSVGVGMNIDAEEADRLELSLDVIEAVLSDPSLAGWDGFGVVVQAYGKRAPYVLDWLYDLAERHDRRVMARLVKGAYWDSEIKAAQVEGLDGFPVFTNKTATDVAYIACARRLLGMTDRIYPQFATHNAHTVAAVLEMADDVTAFEFQRLHGMGEALHDLVMAETGGRCRIYAPVGAHKDLLAYLVRRLLENGANSSFVNMIVDEETPPEDVAADPFVEVEALPEPAENPRIALPPDLYGDSRRNARGWDLTDPVVLAEIERARTPFQDRIWRIGPLTATDDGAGPTAQSVNPAEPDEVVAVVTTSSAEGVAAAIAAARPWDAPVADRAAILNAAADLYETHFGELFALTAREAGKNLPDCVAELREAVDFLRYYAAEALDAPTAAPRGLFACISPWNFPVAIFTGQIAAALAAGNAVVAKPAEQTPAVAWTCVRLLHEAGVPETALQLLIGDGPTVGAAMTGAAGAEGVCFTGSTATAQAIHRAMAGAMTPAAPLIAETGGLNAMIVDSTALPEQAVRDILASAFQSAGQRCSALRCLYIQEDVADGVLELLFGAMDELKLGAPWATDIDVGPVIDEDAQASIAAHIAAADAEGRVLKSLATPVTGRFVAPTVIRIDGVQDLEEEIFGPVLHVATFQAEDLDETVQAINRTGYGLTFGLHTRIDDRVQQIVDDIHVGNIYVNRNQIGAIVGSQPFGGENLSGTGPKAGGPLYLSRFRRSLSEAEYPAPGDELEMPGPTGESNRLRFYGRGNVLCLGPGAELAAEQAETARAMGCVAVERPDGNVDLAAISEIAAVVFWGDERDARRLRQTLAARPGPILPFVMDRDLRPWLLHERHLCIDVTAAGGNASLLAESDQR